MFFRFLIAALLMQTVSLHPKYKDAIPNGDKVPSPCQDGGNWAGVGHLIMQGAGANNQFGLDFAQADHKWNKELCNKDSDGDGRTNGEELGDPQCTWTKQGDPTRNDTITHPGICEPLHEKKCLEKPLNDPKYKTQKDWLDDVCNNTELRCPALNETGLMSFEVRIPDGTRVPAKGTTYECMIFDLEKLGIMKNETYHIVAVKPIINNTDVLHHMVLSGCDERNVKPTNDPFDCGMSDQCMEFLHVWTVGLPGECYHPEAGMRIGVNGSKIVSLQLHWNNPLSKDNLIDSSGLEVFYTKKLRQYDAGILSVGSVMFHLPPGQKDVVVHGKCSGSCTNKYVKKSINITSVWNHMHFSGHFMSVEVSRGGKHIISLTNDTDYSYESPLVYQYKDNPFVLLPGDDILTTCGFTTADKNKTISYGEGTFDEMCFGFLSFYPRENFDETFCVDQLGISWCDDKTWDGCPNPYVFHSNITGSEVYKEVTQNCVQYAPCLTECKDTIVKFMKGDPCMQGKIWQFEQEMFIQTYNANNTNKAGIEFLSRLASCKIEVDQILNSRPAEACPSAKPFSGGNNFATQTASASLSVLVFSFLVVQVWG